jgi:hypothetical protein
MASRTTPKKDRSDEIKKLCADIDLGRMDDHVGPLFNTIRKRMGEQMVGLPWYVTVGDVTFGMDDMSLMSLAAVEEETGRTWHVVHPETSAREYKAIVAAHLSIDRGWPDERVVELLRSIKGQSDIVASISFGVVKPDPFVISGT